MNTKEILDLKFESGDLGKEVTIREFFHQLIRTLWIEGEGFSGKRPFGNSGWDIDLITCLITHKVIPGTLDDDGYIKEYNSIETDKFILNVVIKQIFSPV